MTKKTKKEIGNDNRLSGDSAEHAVAQRARDYGLNIYFGINNTADLAIVQQLETTLCQVKVLNGPCGKQLSFTKSDGVTRYSKGEIHKIIGYAQVELTLKDGRKALRPEFYSYDWEFIDEHFPQNSASVVKIEKKLKELNLLSGKIELETGFPHAFLKEHQTNLKLSNDLEVVETRRNGKLQSKNSHENKNIERNNDKFKNVPGFKYENGKLMVNYNNEWLTVKQCLNHPDCEVKTYDALYSRFENIADKPNSKWTIRLAMIVPHGMKLSVYFDLMEKKEQHNNAVANKTDNNNHTNRVQKTFSNTEEKNGEVV